jgi:hypothetical protein
VVNAVKRSETKGNSANASETEANRKGRRDDRVAFVWSKCVANVPLVTHGGGVPTHFDAVEWRERLL